jgi:Neurotransmitter-gated ion-channel ligand binding domain
VTLLSFCHGKHPRLAHTTAGLAHYGLDQIWHPRVVTVNETNTVTRRLPESVEVTSDGTVVYRQRYVGPFTQPLHLQSFLFDKQTFRIHFIAVRYTPNEVNFVPDHKESIRMGDRLGHRDKI